MSRVLLSVLLLLTLAWPGGPALGQADQTEQVPPDSGEPGDVESAPVDPAEPVEPETVPTASLASSLDEGNARVRELRAMVTAIPVTVGIESGLPEVSRQTQELLARQEALSLETLSLHRLELMHEQWIRTGAKLKDWQRALDDRSTELSQADQQLNKMAAQWNTIVTSAVDSGVPEELLAQVRAVQSSIDDVDKQIGDQLSSVLVLLGRVTELRTTSTQANIEVEQARVLARKRILSPDSPSLWDAVLHPTDRVSLSKQVKDTWNQDAEQFRIFMNLYRRRVPIQALFFVTMTLVMLFLWLRIRKREPSTEDPGLETAKLIFSRPLSAATMLTIATARLFYPQAPLFMFEANILIALIPVLRLVPRLIVPGLRPVIYGLSGVFAMDQLHAMTAEESLLQRLILLLTASAGLVGAIWIVRPGGRASTYDGGGWWKAAVVGMRLSVVLFFWAVVSNLIGSVELAELLTEATLTSAFGGVASAVCAVVLEALMTMAIRSRWARSTGMVSRHEDMIARRSRSVIRLVVFAGWLFGTLNLFRLLEITIDVVAIALSKTWTLGNLTISIGNVLAFFSAILVSIYISRFIRFVLEEDIFPRLPLQRGVPSTLSMLINYSILTVGFLSAMAIAGFEVSQFAYIFGALGVGIGFGLQNIVNNFISGLILVFERPIKVGDTIEVGTTIGEVRAIGIRASTVRTFDGAELIVPNGNLISAEVINWTLSDRIRRIKIPVGVAYGTDPQRVLDILGGVAKNSKDVLSFPEPVALFQGFGASSLDFELRAWTANFERWMRVGSALTVEINKALAEAGIQIPFPQRDLHLRSVEPSVEQALSGVQRREPSEDKA